MWKLEVSKSYHLAQHLVHCSKQLRRWKTMIVTKPGPRKFVRGWAPGKDSRGPLAEKRVRLQGADSCGETDRPCDRQRVVQVLPLTHIFSVCFLAIKDQCKKCVLYKHTIKIPFNLFLTMSWDLRDKTNSVLVPLKFWKQCTRQSWGHFKGAVSAQKALQRTEIKRRELL